ncbi:MAG: hypothetical protein JXJ22_07300 [Bacteroidales bacterium]|nr:hypothetical protein [Bacteroidales bacterium]
MIQIREEAFKYYFYFLEERMSIFWKKCKGQCGKLSDDEIFNTYKFTNVYRATDRVSQYLIRNVIYNDKIDDLNEIDTLLRIIVFKIFNKIETWEYLESRLGTIKQSNFDLNSINKLLLERRQKQPIFSNAYMMTGTHQKYNHLDFKHEKWLQMVNDELLIGGIFKKIINAKSLNEIFDLLNNCSFIGGFLAYQYTIDFNYSSVIEFNENSFVKAGIGAIRGIKKCFKTLDKYSYEDAIKFTQENLEGLQIKYRYTNFENLYGRKPTLIDLQNCFCETDKYLRARLPELNMGNVRIKQRYRIHSEPLKFFFPPKWGINDKVIAPCLQQNMKELTLF